MRAVFTKTVTLVQAVVPHQSWYHIALRRGGFTQSARTLVVLDGCRRVENTKNTRTHVTDADTRHVVSYVFRYFYGSSKTSITSHPGPVLNTQISYQQRCARVMNICVTAIFHRRMLYPAGTLLTTRKVCQRGLAIRWFATAVTINYLERCYRTWCS